MEADKITKEYIDKALRHHRARTMHTSSVIAGHCSKCPGKRRCPIRASETFTTSSPIRTPFSFRWAREAPEQEVRHGLYDRLLDPLHAELLKAKEIADE